MQWLIRQYHLSDQEAADLAEACAAHDYHDFTQSTHVDGGQEFICYGRDGQLPPAVEALLHGLSIQEQRLVDEADLLKPYDPQQPVWLRDDVALLGDDMALPERADNCIRIRLCSGPAFGDGRHPTTRLAANLMRHIPWCEGLSCMDVGAGSGVLGLLAHYSGAQLKALSDIDDDSVRNCGDNLRRNACNPDLARRSDLLQDLVDVGPVQVIIANIYAELLHELLDSLDQQPTNDLLPQGWLILSGISHHKYTCICQDLHQRGWHIIAQAEEAWWHGICAQRGFDK